MTQDWKPDPAKGGEHVEPREWWIDVDGYAHETKREAQSTNPAQKPIHVREVLE